MLRVPVVCACVSRMGFVACQLVHEPLQCLHESHQIAAHIHLVKPAWEMSSKQYGED